MIRIRWSVWLVVVAASAFVPVAALAQTAMVSGVVVDQTGARLPGVTVTLVGEGRDAGSGT